MTSSWVILLSDYSGGGLSHENLSTLKLPPCPTPSGKYTKQLYCLFRTSSNSFQPHRDLNMFIISWKNSEKWYNILNVQIFKHIQFNLFETLILLMIQMISQSYHCLPNNPIKEDMLRLWGQDYRRRISKTIMIGTTTLSKPQSFIYRIMLHSPRSGRFTPLGFSFSPDTPTLKANIHSMIILLPVSYAIFYWFLFTEI